MSIVLHLSRRTARSPEWAEVRTIIAQRLARARADLESAKNTEVMTAALRGRIAELKELDALAEVPPQTKDDGPHRRSIDD